MNLLKLLSFFSKNKKVKLLGRAGIHYFENGITFFVDSEMLLPPPHNVVIYADTVSKVDEPSKILDNSEKLRIANMIKDELEKSNNKVLIEGLS